MANILAASGGVKQIICINWGTKYGAPFINRLYAMVARNITPPFTFTCFTDSFEGLRPEILCEDLPPLNLDEMPTNTPGIWQKSRLWGPKLGNLKGPVLFLDLDLVIVGSLDSFFEVGEPDDVILAKNQTTPFERLGQTSLFRFQVGKLVPLQQKFTANPQGIADEYRFEQRFVTRNAPGGVKLFPRRWVLHFRQDCHWTFPLNYFFAPRLPANARVVLFPAACCHSTRSTGNTAIAAASTRRLGIFAVCSTATAVRRIRSATCATISALLRGWPTIGANSRRPVKTGQDFSVAA